MRFEWDEAKNQANKAKHGVDFVRIQLLFDGRPVETFPSTYPHEERWLTVGVLAGRFYTVVWTPRGEAVRIISVRRSRDAEVRQYRSVHE